MVGTAFSHVSAWVFDLDHTLYPPSARLFDQVEARITAYVSTTLGLTEAAADRLRLSYWQDHGTTLAGLMREHGLDPVPYLDHVHDISMDSLQPDPQLAGHIGNLKGRRIVYTNGSAPYAERVLEARGLSGLFDAVYGVEHAGYIPKPQDAAFRRIFNQDGIDPTRAAMFEDDPRNLRVPHAMGMRTVHVADHPVPEAHIEFHTDNLSAFLARLI